MRPAPRQRQPPDENGQRPQEQLEVAAGERDPEPLALLAKEPGVGNVAVLPPLTWLGWGKYQAWKAEQAARAALEELERQAEADQLVTRITTDVEPIIDEARVIELSSPPKTLMQPLRPEAIDLDKLTRPGAPAKAGEY